MPTISAHFSSACAQTGSCISSGIQTVSSAVVSAALKIAALSVSFFNICGQLLASGYNQMKHLAMMSCCLMKANPGATYIGVSAVALTALLAVVYTQNRSAEEV
ncbi:MAG: hypothetical protein HY861_00210 [Chlamydiia bacterium]|nr:hypothetical protein [Chlamydiia bacterium]